MTDKPRVVFEVYPDWDKAGRIYIDKDLPTQGSTDNIFSKTQGRHLINAGLETNGLSAEEAEGLLKQINESPLPESLGGLVFIECGRCKGHGWLVHENFQPASVVTKRQGRRMIENPPPDAGLTPEELKKALEQIEASSLQ